MLPDEEGQQCHSEHPGRRRQTDQGFTAFGEQVDALKHVRPRRRGGEEPGQLIEHLGARRDGSDGLAGVPQIPGTCVETIRAQRQQELRQPAIQDRLDAFIEQQPMIDPVQQMLDQQFVVGGFEL